MFDPAPGQPDFPRLEEEVLAFWRRGGIYQQSLDRRAGGPSFVFYEGPPTANGKPHPGHCLTRAIKDLFPRYKTMRGYHCRRKAGWDTHGLPVEVEVCKELGIHSKSEIEAYGVEPFIHRCQESVWRYMQDWEKLTERIGFWINLDEAYVTYHRSFVESVWWSLKSLFDRGLLYQGHKIVWWWAQGGTALSAGEVGQGYREVADPSVYVHFPLVGPPDGRELTVPGADGGTVDLTGVSLLVWTTTPWTLPSNQFAAVHPDLIYAVATDGETGEKLLVAADLVATLAEKAKRTLSPGETVRGADLIGLRYRPPFDTYVDSDWNEAGPLADGSGKAPLYWRVTAADFVTTDSGTGLVHEAPAFGEVDYQLLLDEQGRFAPGEGPGLFCPVGPDGLFTGLTGELADLNGTWVKDADKTIVRRLRESGRLFHQEQYLHEYPFCWRADQDPLIQYPRKSWFIRTTAFRDAMLADNSQINWLPGHIRDGRFGNFLESNVDWALSRERYWGTPLPIWACDKTGRMEAVGGYEELLTKPGVTGAEVWEQAKADRPDLSDDLKVHKPYIDAITYDSPYAPGGRMARVPEVIDCWYDSGAMPFAQWGYPHAGGETFASQFPADFISEALDQTRGWFYSQLAISTMLFGAREQGAGGGEQGTDTEALLPRGEKVAAGRMRGESGPSTTKSEAPLTPNPSPLGGEGDRTPVDYPHPFRTCIVLGLMLAEWYESKDGKQRFLTEEEARAAIAGDVVKKTGKMSKSLRNYRDPQEIFDKYGADALRWYFFSQQPPWNSILYSERAIRESIPEFQLRLWHTYAFFLTYARIDGFDPADGWSTQEDGNEGGLGGLSAKTFATADGYPPVSERSELDRWLLSELQATVATVTAALDRYDNYAACRSLIDFVDGLSNWYIRRSRDRFWSATGAADGAASKREAYWTTYEALVTVSKLIAPMMPFLAETMWRGLTGVFGDRVLASVHLADWPEGDPSRTDEVLSARMALVRQIASLGRAARSEAKIKVRQPLSRVEVVLPDETSIPWLTDHDDILREELNVHEIAYHPSAGPFVTYQIVPNFRALGPRVGKLMPQVKQALAAADGAELYGQLQSTGTITLAVGGETVELTGEEVAVRLTAKEGYAAAQDRSIVVVLATELTDELVREGLANDVIRLIQDRRKELALDYTDRIAVAVDTADESLRRAILDHEATIRRETLTTDLAVQVDTVLPSEATLTVGDRPLVLTVRKA